ncbi:MAG TPA: hypothetical protein VEI50_12430 [Nitrospiraceae bacterium]|nr:hypothetical protein [Nitrospiraceae bacterium]
MADFIAPALKTTRAASAARWMQPSVSRTALFGTSTNYLPGRELVRLLLRHHATYRPTIEVS